MGGVPRAGGRGRAAGRHAVGCAGVRDRGEEDVLLGSLLPDGVRWAEGTGEPEGLCPYPEEEALMARAVPGRRREFAAARVCAHRALAAL
ncbi:hypothetical protein ACWEPZ_37515, partial [Streptomyces sp. NPDC004288]